MLTGVIMYSETEAQWSGDPDVNNLISTWAGPTVYPQICHDGKGGALIAWKSGGIYAQRISGTGVVEWSTNKITICTASDCKYDLQVCSDRSCVAIITWLDFRLKDDRGKDF